MPDISMCLNKSCPSYKRCYRAQAVPNMRQSWASFKVLDGNMRCDEYMEIGERDGLSKIVGATDSKEPEADSDD